MQKAIRLAKIARSRDEVPVGALIIKNEKIVGQGYNQKEQQLPGRKPGPSIVTSSDSRLSRGNSRLETQRLFKKNRLFLDSEHSVGDRDRRRNCFNA